MKNKIFLSKKVIISIDEAVKHYEEHRASFESIVRSLTSDILDHPELKEIVHSVKFRTKDPASLKKKLLRKAKEAKQQKKKFNISSNNLFSKITDLAGIRILHLHPKQMLRLKPLLENLLSDLKYETIERIAYTWDEEYKLMFLKMGYKAKFKPSMYTSLHHVVTANRRKQLSCEIQVRTLMEEVWGEVDHTINYPDESSSLACKEQLKALARMSSAGTRLVDSIFASHEEHATKKNRKR